MRRIAILNQKGGVGKTTTAVNLSAALAAQGRRVTLLDLDPQAHATLHLGVEPGPDDRTIYDVLTGDTSIAEVRKPIEENLWLVGSHIDLAAADMELAGVVGREVILRDKLAADAATSAAAGEAAADGFLLIDCPPSLGVLTINALAAVDEVIIPLQPHFLALHGLGKLLDTIDLVARRLNPKLRLTGVVLCMFESATRLAAEVSRDVEDFLGQSRGRNTPWSDARVFATRIRRNIRLAEAPSFGQSILRYAPDSHGAEDYRRLAAEMRAACADEPTSRPAQDGAEESRSASADVMAA
ncbi:MAG: ParA family protein [Planctomycetia bacterium]|nr:ParA family protein [Planctomycetia bacterium]